MEGTGSRVASKISLVPGCHHQASAWSCGGPPAPCLGVPLSRTVVVELEALETQHSSTAHSWLP